MVVEPRWHLVALPLLDRTVTTAELLHCEGMQLHPARYLAFRHSYEKTQDPKMGPYQTLRNWQLCCGNQQCQDHTLVEAHLRGWCAVCRRLSQKQRACKLVFVGQACQGGPIESLDRQLGRVLW